MNIKDTNLTIKVKDMEASIAFYQSIGFTVKERWGNHYAQLTAPGIVIGLHPSERSASEVGSGNVSIGFTSDNFEQIKSHLKESGITVAERQEEGGDFLHFTDPDGTKLYFIKPKW